MMAWLGLNYDVTNNCYFVLTVHKTFCGKAKKRFCQPQLLTKRRQSAIAIDYKEDDATDRPVTFIHSGWNRAPPLKNNYSFSINYALCSTWQVIRVVGGERICVVSKFFGMLESTAPTTTTGNEIAVGLWTIARMAINKILLKKWFVESEIQLARND